MTLVADELQEIEKNKVAHKLGDDSLLMWNDNHWLEVCLRPSSGASPFISCWQPSTLIVTAISSINQEAHLNLRSCYVLPVCEYNIITSPCLRTIDFVNCTLTSNS